MYIVIAMKPMQCTDCKAPNNAQLEGTLYHSPKLHPGLCSNVGMRQDTDTQMVVANIHFTLAMHHAKCN